MAPNPARKFRERRKLAIDFGSHSPSSTAELSIEEFWRSCLDFVEWRNSTAHQLNEKSRVEVQSAGLKAFGCSGIAMTESAEQRFWAPELVRLRPKGKASVRIEPENPHVCYVLIDRSWITAKTGDAQFFEVLDPVAQFAESLRLRECVSVRVALRDEAHCEFLQSQRRKRAQPAQLPVPLSSPFATGAPQKSIGLFERSRNIDVAEFDATPTEVVK